MTFTLRPIEPEGPDLAMLQALHLRCAAFVEETTGHPPRDDEADRLLAFVPSGKSRADKLVFGVIEAGEMVGVVELLREYPQAHDWYLGLLLLSPEVRGVGVGASVLEQIVEMAAAEGVRELHLIVREDNPRALRFWRRHGFEIVDRRVQDLGTKTNLVFKMIRSL